MAQEEIETHGRKMKLFSCVRRGEVMGKEHNMVEDAAASGEDAATSGEDAAESGEDAATSGEKTTTATRACGTWSTRTGGIRLESSAVTRLTPAVAVPVINRQNLELGFVDAHRNKGQLRAELRTDKIENGETQSIDNDAIDDQSRESEASECWGVTSAHVSYKICT